MLQWVSPKGHIAVMRFLLDIGADVNAYDEWGYTVSQRASQGGGEAVARLLLEKGADFTAQHSP